MDEIWNNYDLESVRVITPGEFNVGDTMEGWGEPGSRDYWVHYRDEDTLLIKPVNAPEHYDWSPCHIYGRGGFEGA